MGWIGSNYTKEGKGVTKGGPEKNGFFLFFELLGRKFTNLLKLNMLYFVVSIPFLVLIFFVSRYVISFNELFSMKSLVNTQQAMQVDGLMRLTMVVLLWVFWGAGPVTAGFVYNLRNYAREEHTWMWSDFFEKTKENFKQGSLLFILDIFVFIGGLLSARFYLKMSLQSPVWMLPQVILFLVLLIYTLMHTYIYQLMVTFKLRFGQTLKNAFLMVIAKFPMNIILSFIVVAITCILVWISGSFWLLLVPFIYVSFCAFILHFYATHMIKRYFIDPYSDQDNIGSIFEEK